MASINDITNVSELIDQLERTGTERVGGYHCYPGGGTGTWRVGSVDVVTVHGPATVTVAAHRFYTTVDGGRSANVQIGVEMPGLAARPDWNLLDLGLNGPSFSNLAGGADLRGHGPVYVTPVAPANAPLWDQVAALLNSIVFV